MTETHGVLADERDRYRLLIDNISDYAIYLIDCDGRVASWNPGAERFKGYDRSEIIGRHFSQFYTSEDRAAGLPALALSEAAREGRFEREGWRLRKDGTRFWAHVIIDAIRQDGELVGYAKITRDLTERRGQQEALRKSEEQLRLLIEGVTDYAIYMLDSSGEITSWNAGAERIKGYAADEIIGEHFSRFYTDEDQALGMPQRALDIAAHVGRYEQEGWRIRRDGSRFFAHVIIDAICDDAGQVIGFAKVTRDISERIEAQREIEVAREALFQSQKLEAIGQLTGGVAHDFNNLLMAIIGSLDIVKKRMAHDPRVSPLIDNALHGARRGAALTQRMLAFARRQELQIEPVDVPGLVRGMRDFIARSIGPSVEIRLRLDSDLPRALTDPIQLESALLNLALNARDAMIGGGVLTFSAALDDIGAGVNGLSSGDYIKISVGDDGSGMAPDVAARAAEPFFTTKGVGKGTGLGLSMVHGLVAQSGGKVEIQTAPGQGTCIMLWLPVSTAEAPEGRPAPLVTASSEQAVHVVLTVDDDPLVLLNNQMMLEELGHQVLAAESAAQALDLLTRHPEIDLVLTDQLMPGMSGLELAEKIAERRPDIRIILATGFADIPSGQPQALERLTKPYDLAALDAALTGKRPGDLS